MKTVTFRLLILAFVVAGTLHGQDSQDGQDTIFLRQGEALAGRIAGFDGRTIRLQRFLPPLSGVPPNAAPVSALVTISISHVDRVEFSSAEGRNLNFETPTPANLFQAEALWRKTLLWLSIPRSAAGEIGVSYGNLLLEAGDVPNAQKALGIFRMIENGSWSEPARARARQGRLRAMIATDDAQQAVVEAEKIVQTAEDPAILLEAKLILAQVAHKRWEDFLVKNPRWAEDTFAIPEHNRLYEQALELYLYPALFFGSEIQAAARGLWGAVEIYQRAGDLEQALEASRDLVSIYPDTLYARQAQALIESVPRLFEEARQ